MAEIKVKKIKLSLTSNGTPKVLIWGEDNDTDNLSEAIEIIGELESLYALTRRKGDTLTTIQKGKWVNLQVDDNYLKAFNSPNYDRVKYLFKRSLSALNEAVNGTRPELDFEMAKMLFTDNLDLHLRTQEYILDLLKKSKTSFAKQIVTDLKSDNADVKFNAYQLLDKLASKCLYEVKKDYRINNGEEPKQDKKNNQ